MYCKPANWSPSCESTAQDFSAARFEVPELIQSLMLPDSRGMRLLDMSDPTQPEHAASAGGMRSAEKAGCKKGNPQGMLHLIEHEGEGELAGHPVLSLLYAQTR